MAKSEDPDKDYRSDRMPSSEGHGRAKAAFGKAWESYKSAVRPVTKPLEPLVKPLADKMAGALVSDLLGFWLVWHLQGGFEGLQQIGMSRASIYRRIAMFRKFMGVHPDDYVMPGVDIDIEKYLKREGGSISPRPTSKR